MFLYKTALPMLALPRLAKRGLVLSVDASLCILTVWLAFCLRLGEWVTLSGSAYGAVGASLALALPIFMVSGLYRAIFRYAGGAALITIARANAVYGLIYAAIFTAIGVKDVPRTIGLIQPMLLLLGVGASRAFARYWLSGLYQNQRKHALMTKVLIYGAGSAGRRLADAIVHHPAMQVVGFLDDDARLHHRLLNGVTIYPPSDLRELVDTRHISDVLLAIPSVNRKRRNEILHAMRHAKVTVRTLPGVIELAQGRVQTTDLRELEIDDLLGRDPVAPEPALLAKHISEKVVLVTGAGGSIGHELCRQILQVHPTVLILLEHSEFALYSVHQSLLAFPQSGSDTSVRLVPLLASVCDENRMRAILSVWKPHTIYHAAAYKHVPLVEHNLIEGLKNNVFGALTTAKIAQEQGVPNFVLISTDKAVRPTNVMGASKRLAEMILQALALESPATNFSMVRFGNVLGSSGSVIPKFRQQIKAGGPLTLTHPQITRYFMTIPEAAQLVIQAGAMAHGGEVFVLDMGTPVKIIDLARQMIELSGLSVRDAQHPDGDIEIKIIGLRPGEKLYEELLIGNESVPTSHPRIMKAHDAFLQWPALEPQLHVLQHALHTNAVVLARHHLTQIVPDYQPSSDIVDWTHLEQAV